MGNVIRGHGGRLSVVLIGGLVAAGCCFGSNRGVTVDPPPPPVDPSLDAVWACIDATVVDHRCPAPLNVLTTDQFVVGLTFRTQNLARFAMPGALVALVGTGAPLEIAREATGNTAGAVVPPGETLTWDEYISLRCPDAGWPVGMPVTFEMRDATGARVAATVVTFVGPQLAPPPLHAEDVLNVCSDATMAGTHDDPYCPLNELAVPHGRGYLYVSYTSGVAVTWIAGATMVLERRNRRGGYESESELSIEPAVLPPGEVQTFHTSYPLDQPIFAAHSHWRVRMLVMGETLAVRELDIE